MGYPTRDNRGGNRGGERDFGGRSFGGGRPTRPVEMHQAACSTCSKECEVPFRPSGEKPVYCRDCFAKNRSHEGERNFGNNRDNREAPRGDFKRFDEKPIQQAPRNNELDVINSKLDLILKMLKSTPTEASQLKKESKPEKQEAKETPAKVVKKKRVSKKTESIIELPSDNPTE